MITRLLYFPKPLERGRVKEKKRKEKEEKLLCYQWERYKKKEKKKKKKKGGWWVWGETNNFFSLDALLLSINPHGHFKFMIVPTFWQFGNIFPMTLFKTAISRIDILIDSVIETGQNNTRHRTPLG